MNLTALPCSLTQTSGSPQQGHGLTFSLLQWLFVSVCGCACLALCVSYMSENLAFWTTLCTITLYPSKSMT